MTHKPIIERKSASRASAPEIATHMAFSFAKDGKDTLLVSHDGKAKANRTKAASICDALTRACFMAQRPSNGGIAIVIDNQPVFVNNMPYFPIPAQVVDKLVSDLKLALGHSLGLIFIQE